GGSVANLTALLAARGALCPEAWRDGVPGRLAILAPPSSHYSVQRAAGILGLGTGAVVPLPADEWGVVRAGDIAAAADRVRDDGMRCMAIVANACATATGLHDPLRAMGEYCRSEGIWFHVDACHGATALLGRESRRFLDGIELADSVVWDTHKMMQVPTLCAAVLFRNSGSFDAAFRQEASYLAYGADRDAYDSLPRALECTKAALGLKVFMNLAWRGERALGNYVDERYAITRRFRRIALSRPGFDAPYEPESNILCLRFGDDDALQESIRRGLMVDGEFHLSSALLGGRRYLRITVMNALTDETVFTALLDAIERRAAQGIE
ncbi:MAG: pyridoxal-dependent decarboxylase, partial [Pseudomonadota bacterium]